MSALNYPNKIQRSIFVPILTLFTLLPLSIALIPSPAYAGRMIWSPVDTPSTAFNVIASPSEISSFKISSDGRTFYAIDTANSRVYRSDDAGASWFDLSNYLVTAGATLPAWDISVAPDNPRFLAVVTTTGGLPRRLFVSADGGQSWSDTIFSATANISALDISPFYGNYDIALGTRAGGAGNVYIYKATGMGGTWIAQGLAGDILALKFSPGYKSDPSIAVLYATNSGTYFNAGIRDLNANTTNWAAIYSSTPPEITAGGSGTSPKVNQIITGDIELPADYSGQSPAMCRAYISTDSLGGNAGIYRVDNNVVFQLMNALPNRRISSIAYFGTYMRGKLLAGEVLGDPTRATVLTWYTDAPMTCPATCWYQAEKPPTGARTSSYGNAQVAWAPDGSRAYCGTGSALLNSPATWPTGNLNSMPLDESAFSISRDNGKTWNQTSLIDTQISFLSDVAVSPDSNTIYLASINNIGSNPESIWHSDGQPSGKSWERVLCVPSASNDIILRMSNYGNDQAIFFASRGTDDLRQSQDTGQTWKALLPGMIITDFSVTSINNSRYIYALAGTYIRKGNVSSLIPQWSQQLATTLSAGHTIFGAPNGVVVVGGDTLDNRVAFSPDGANSFYVTPVLPIAGRVHTIADYRLSNTFIIYAATDNPDSDIYNWIPGSGPWNYMGTPDTGFYGLAQMTTLYGAANSIAGPIVDRTLSPEALGPPAIEWSVLNAGLLPGVVFTREPISLKLSSGINLWAIDNRLYNYESNTGRLWTFCDCLSPSPQYSTPPPPSRDVLFAPPLPFTPRPDDLIPVNITDNSVGNITFQWKHNTTAIAYELWLAKDRDFTQILTQKIINPENRRAPTWTLPDKKGIEPGKTYYWKIRIVQAATGEKGTGTWSDISSFTVAENKAKPPITQSPPLTITENKTAQSMPPDSGSSLSASDNKSQASSFPFTLDNNPRIWLLIAALFMAFTIAVITGILYSRRKL